MNHTLQPGPDTGSDVVQQVELHFPDETESALANRTARCLGGELRFLLDAFHGLPTEEIQQALLHYLATEPVPSLERCSVHSVQIIRSSSGGEEQTVELAGRSSMETEHNDFGRVEVLYASEEVGVYWLRIFPGRSIPTHVHRIMDESEMILTEGLLLQNLPAKLGSARHWPKDFPHKYENPTEHEQVILCVDRPSFIPSDEIVVSLAAAELQTIDSKGFYSPQGES